MARRFELARYVDNGRFDIAIAAIVGGSLMLVNASQGLTGALALDFAAYTLAALTVRWPRTAGMGLAVLLAGYNLLPVEWGTAGELATYVPVLGAGMRGLRRQRLWMTLVYLPVLVSLDAVDGGRTNYLISAVGWAVQFAILWLVGNLFANFRRLNAQAAQAALVQQRLATATALHDAAARTLSRGLLAAERARSRPDGDALDILLGGVRQASGELRQTLAALTAESGHLDQLEGPRVGLTEAMAEAEAQLGAAGFTPQVVVTGDPASLPAEVSAALAAAVGELVANIERHAAPGTACRLTLLVGPGTVELAADNELGPESGRHAGSGLGLAGLRDRAGALGGTLVTGPQDGGWRTTFSLPVAALV